MPRVTRLDGPSQVTFGGGGDIATSPSSRSRTSNVQRSDGTDASINHTIADPRNALSTTTSRREDSSTSIPTTSTSKSVNPNPDSTACDSWQEKGGMVSIVSSSAESRRLYWSQDRYSVVLRMELLSAEEKVQTIEVEGAVPYQDRFCAVGTTKAILRAFSASPDLPKKQLLLEGELPHAVHYAEDDDNIEWSVERSRHNERFLTITLYKAAPVQGVSIWWRRPFMEFDEIDDITSDDASNRRSQSFQQAWEEAHKIFQERRQHGKQSIGI